MYFTFNRCDKREFDRAFRDGLPVSIAKDPSWAAANETFVSTGFTRETVADPYQDGPSRAGEKWSYWVAEVASATLVGPVEYHYTGNALRGDGVAAWRFWCGSCNMWCTFDDKGTAEDSRARNVAAHAGVIGKDPTPWRHVGGARVADPHGADAPQGGYTFAPRPGYTDFPDRYISTRRSA